MQLERTYMVLPTSTTILTPDAIIEFLSKSCFTYENEVANDVELKEKFAIDFCNYLEVWASMYRAPLFLSEFMIQQIDLKTKIKKNDFKVLSDREIYALGNEAINGKKA